MIGKNLICKAPKGSVDWNITVWRSSRNEDDRGKKDSLAKRIMACFEVEMIGEEVGQEKRNKKVGKEVVYPFRLIEG